METPVLLKKYANRRLYNTSDSKYITLEELSNIIRKGNLVKVVDAKTKEDVTAYILTQIVLEQAKKNNTLLPVPLLHLIIQYGDNVLVEFFDKYLQQIIQTYLDYKQSMDKQFKRWLDLGTGITEATQQSLQTLNPFQNFFEGFSEKNDNDKNDKTKS